MTAALLILSLAFPAAVALGVAFARGSAERVGAASRMLAWIYAALAAATSIAALATTAGISVAGSVLRLGATGFEMEPRLFLDGRSAPFLLLLGLCPPVVFTFLRGFMAQRSQHALAWALITALAGVFLSDSLLLFYLFWEAALIAVYFWIGLHGRRSVFGGGVYPVLLRFVLFTLAGSLPMLVSIAAASAAGFRDPGVRGLAAAVAQLPDGTRAWVFGGFLLGFAVKLPLLGFHGWLRDTYTVAPPACRALLSAAMSKMGAYGLLLVLAPAFPAEMARFGTALQILAAAGALYGGLLMLAQDRLVDVLAYGSLSHLSLLALGVFSAAAGGVAASAGFSGAALLALSHALIMALLFALDARALKDGESPDRLRLSGLRARQGRLFAFLLLAAFASASLPGLANFPGELLVYLAAFKASPWLTLVAGLGALLGAAALVRLLHDAWLGKPEAAAESAQAEPSPDLNTPETLTALALALIWLVLGLYPMLLLGPVSRAFSFVSALGWAG